MRHAEVGIVGAGPAGARAAELLAGQGVEVVVFDPKVPWEKPCGGGLTPAVFEELPDLEEVKPLARPIDRARIELGPQVGFEVELHDRIWVISREALGRWQLDRALEAGVTHEPQKVGAIRRTASGWTLDTDREAWHVSYLIGADGAASTVRRVAAPGLSVELVPARVAYPGGAGEPPDTLVLRFYEGLVGYLWDFPRLDHHSVGIEVACGAWQRAALDGRIDEYRASGAPGPSLPPARAGAVIGTARLGHGDFSGISGDRFALLGDAAGFADPFTGEGIRNALRSADLLARALDMERSRWSETYAALAREALAREFAFARLLRRSLSESGAGVRLVEWAVSSDIAYATVAAVLNAVTFHTYSPFRVLSLWYRALKGVRADARPRDAKGAQVAAPTRRPQTAG